ncbi:matrixin family metalloprotease [Hymenobacter elongatus]|uniref:Matrixin family metalloprotease n=1 Tax=Hymenobacter elongatus TaxID=877208 RepID=A0A4Z0PPU0_9BACT|nr:matrixin family metalloprotease [Hymenobacter elongatus]TGE19700.1 matrixin family metalloprotease [Hymenobacter elongatus]
MKSLRTLNRLVAGSVLLAALCATPGAAQNTEADGHCLLVPLSAAERASRSGLVVEGEVLDARSFWDAAHRRIYTAHQIRVYSVLKGQLPGQLLTVLTEGGRVGFDEHILTNTLRLYPGEQGILFLSPAAFSGATAPPSWTPYASEQGFIRYNLTDASAAEPFRVYPRIGPDLYAELQASLGQPRRIVQPNPTLRQAQLRVGQPVVAARGQAPVITDLSPTVVPAGVEEILTLNGSGFGNDRGTGRVEFRNADDGGATFVLPQVADYISWTDTQIRVRVPSYSITGSPAGTGTVRVTTTAGLQANSATVLTVPYAASNVQAQERKTVVRPNHINQNGEGGYTFRFESGFASNVAAVQAFQRALFSGWRCQTGVNWTIGPVRTATGIGSDGENSVGFDKGAELPQNVLGRTTSYYLGCTNTDGSIGFHVSEIDMQLDDAVNWQYGPGLPSAVQFDFESVVLHELGHAQQLGHVNTLTAVMYFGVGRGRSNRALSVNDRTGGRAVLRTRSFVPAGCGPAPMLPAPLTRVAASFVSGTGVEITWATRDECLLRDFLVERAVDTTSWQTVATVAAGAAGSTYRVADPQPLAGVSYYRLRLRRPDGTLDNTAPLLVQDAAASADVLQVYPNPVQDSQLRFLYSGTLDGTLSVYLYDAVGRACQVQGVDTRIGPNVRSVNVSALRPGWYVLRWRDQAGRTGATPFVKVN